MNILWLIALLGVAHGAEILAVLPVGAPSHLRAYTALTRGLAERGHSVTLVAASPQQLQHPNQRVIVVGDTLQEASPDFNTSSMLQDGHETLLSQVDIAHLVHRLGSVLVEHTLSHPEVQEVIHKPPGFYSAILLETFLGQEALLGLGHKLQAPVVAMQSHGDVLDLNYYMGGAVSPAYKPHMYLGLSDEMTLSERLLNTIFSLVFLAQKNLICYPQQQALLDKYFPGSPPLQDLMANISLAVVNSHHSLCYAAPHPPNVVMAGGMHINHVPKPLPEALKKFMDEAKDGVVYFSMGTILQASDMTPEQKSAFIESFGALKQRVLVKWNAEAPANLPPNVRLEKWLPQDDILAHPKTRLFITHGGLLSTQEAVYHGVPVLVIPRFGDQSFNSLLAERKGYGLRLDFKQLSRTTVEAGIREVLENPKYAKAMRAISASFREQPISPRDNAVFWVEHVMKHGGDHLRPASVRLTWYQNLLLDVALVALLPVLGLLIALRLACRKRQKRSSAPQKKKKKQ